MKIYFASFFIGMLLFRYILLSGLILVMAGPISSHSLWSMIDIERSVVNSGENNTKTISWNKYRKLKPDDFQARKTRSNKGTAATTASGFGFNITNNNGDISGSIFVKFYMGDSWWNPDNNSSRRRQLILEHEQVHFDICEIFGRKLYKEILNLKSKNQLNSRNLDKLHRKLEKEYHQYQDKYDDDTDHSLNQNAQQRWNSMIKKELKKLEKFADYHSF